MRHRFPPLLPKEALRGPVLVLAAHPDDEVIAAGGMLAWHRSVGHRVVVLHLTDGARGDPDARFDGIGDLRRAEGRDALARLGVDELRHGGFEDGALPERRDAVVALLRQTFAEVRPGTIYSFFFAEGHRDHRALAWATAEAAAALPTDCRCLLYGVNQVVPGGTMFDVGAWIERKQDALSTFVSQLAYNDWREKILHRDHAMTVNIEDPTVAYAEVFADLRPDALPVVRARAAALFVVMSGPDAAAGGDPTDGRPTVSLVISVWNRRDDLRENLAAIAAQTVAPDQIVVVDNASHDGTPEMVRAEFPHVELISMPHAGYGACETFNIGFASARGDFVGILDDDVLLPPDFVERMLAEFASEPESTAILSPKVIEPQMPDWYRDSAEVNTPRYMSTFRGCGSMARREPLRRAGWYDERFFIFGNERDLTTRLLNLGCRVKMVPSIEVFHKAPFGMRHGKRSLYYHVRNFWLWAFKYLPWSKVLGFPFVFLRKGLGGKRAGSGGQVADAVGTIGLFDNIRAVPGGYWICVKATLAALTNLPYCLKRRQVCRHEDFELPIR